MGAHLLYQLAATVIVVGTMFGVLYGWSDKGSLLEEFASIGGWSCLIALFLLAIVGIWS